MIVPVVQRGAVFKTASSHSHSGLKQSAPHSDAKPANHPGFTATSSSPPLHPCCYVQTRATINPAGRAAQTGVSTLSSFEAHADIMFAARRLVGKHWANGNGKTTKRGGQLLRTNGSPSSLASVNEGPQCSFVSVELFLTTNLGQPCSACFTFLFHSRHNAFLSSIIQHHSFNFAHIKKEIFAHLDDDCCNNERLNKNSQIYHL